MSAAAPGSQERVQGWGFGEEAETQTADRCAVPAALNLDHGIRSRRLPVPSYRACRCDGESCDICQEVVKEAATWPAGGIVGKNWCLLLRVSASYRLSRGPGALSPEDQGANTVKG